MPVRPVKVPKSPKAKAQSKQTDVLTFHPHAGQQAKFFASTAKIVIGGGSNGGGKTMALLMKALEGINHQGYEGAIFRAAYPQVTMPGGLRNESEKIYEKAGGALNSTSLEWRFKRSSAIIKLLNCDNPQKYDGLQAGRICMDQLEEFDEFDFWYLISRLRSTVDGIEPRLYATCNPEPNWLRDFLVSGGWLDGRTGYAKPEMDGVVRWLARDSTGTLLWGASAEEMRERSQCPGSGQTPAVNVDSRLGECTVCRKRVMLADGAVVQHANAEPLSATFIRFRVDDNPTLMTRDPSYVANLDALPADLRAKRRDGNWNARASRGLLFHASWWGWDGFTWTQSPNVIDSAEKQASWWWGWDIAWGTRKSSDWSVGVLVGRTPKGITIIADAIRFRAPAHITIQVIRKCAELTGRQVPLVLPHDPGAAKETQSDWALELTNAGFEAHLVADDAKTGSKVARCRLLSTQAERNEFKLLRSHESVGVARWLAQQTSKVGQRVEVSTCQEWHRQIVEALDQLADDCPHWVTDWTDAITKAYNFTIRYDAISPAEVGKPSPPARGNWGTGESWASLSWR